jgi:hypothetical protein
VNESDFDVGAIATRDDRPARGLHFDHAIDSGQLGPATAAADKHIATLRG